MPQHKTWRATEPAVCTHGFSHCLIEERSTEILKFAKADCRDDIEDGRTHSRCPVLSSLWKANPKKSDAQLCFTRESFLNSSLLIFQISSKIYHFRLRCQQIFIGWIRWAAFPKQIGNNLGGWSTTSFQGEPLLLSSGHHWGGGPTIGKVFLAKAQWFHPNDGYVQRPGQHFGRVLNHCSGSRVVGGVLATV